MSRYERYSLDHFHLPQIKRNQQNHIKKNSLYSNNQSILTRFEEQLKYSTNKQKSSKKRPHRLKTIDVNDYESYDDLRRQLRSIKEEVNYSIKEHNHRIQNKLGQYAFLSALKKQQPQVVMQPVPISMPMNYSSIFPYQNMHNLYPPQSLYPYPQNYVDSYQNYSYPNYFPPRPKAKAKPKIYSKMKLKKFKKHVFAVLFTIRLRKFVAKVTRNKKEMFNKYLYNSNQFKQQATRIKKLFIDNMKPLLVTLLQREDSQLRLGEGDSQNFKKEKLSTTRKIIELLIQCVRRSIQSTTFDGSIKSIYYFCRHGSYACVQKLLTKEQLQNMSISQKHYYLQADRNLEKSQIINFLFMKIIVYNIIGQPWKIQPQKFSKDKETLQDNMLIISSIFYQLLMDIQDDLIVNSPQCYILNNYQQLKGTSIYPAESLTVKPGQYRKNQIISGLINENVIKNTYNLEKSWVKQKNQLIEIIESIHHKIANYHRKLIKPFF